MHRLLTALALLLTLTLVPAAPAQAWGGDRVTNAIADKLRATNRGGWLATTLDDGGYHGRRTAQIVRIPAGHGKRWVGIIRVPAGNGGAAARALDGVWFTRNGTRFVLPLVSQYDTRGAAGLGAKTAASWARNRLGAGWVVYAPATR